MNKDTSFQQIANLSVFKVNTILGGGIVRPIAIYGAGNVGKDLYTILSKHGIPVSFFIDQHAYPGAYWHGIPILSPEALDIDQRPRYQILIAVFNRDANSSIIIENLHALGYQHIVSFLDVHAEFAEELGSRFWLTSRTFYKSHLPLCENCDALWADKTSRDLFHAVLHYRLTGDCSLLPSPDLTHQYFPLDIPRWKTPLRFVDCGAFDGDTVVQALDYTKVEALIAFECDPINYTALSNNLLKKRDLLPLESAFFPCAVWSHTTSIAFSGGGLESACVAAESGNMVSCVALDQAIPFFRPTLIKMDIEGSEIEGLWGSRGLIESNKPDLAICLYHRPEHLWQIPLLLNEWNLGYSFYLRTHGFNGFDLVLYAVQNTR